MIPVYGCAAARLTASGAAGHRPGTLNRERQHISQVPLFAARVGRSLFDIGVSKAQKGFSNPLLLI
jgi:hypothetical protein